MANTARSVSSAGSVRSARSAVSLRTNTTSGEAYDVSSNDSVRVVARVRPINAQEHMYGYAEVVSVLPDNRTVALADNAGTGKSYTLDHAFDAGATQEDVFDMCGAKELIDSAIDGFQCTLFAFGQTGSGKTHTITGPDGHMNGLLPRSIYYLFDRVAAQTTEETRFAIQASYLEIYNEQIRDLLNPNSGVLPVRWTQRKGFYVENLYVVLTEDVEDMVAVSVEGMQNRAQRAHDINEHSSRSHAIVTMYITSETVDSNGHATLKHGKLSFVDLAGSERVKESMATGDGLTEARSINRSLLTLGNCIAALSSSKRRKGHIPFRDSKLTKLLKDSLGGNGITVMVACLSPHDLEESTKTLRYAARTKRIQNKPIVQMDPREHIIAQLRQEVEVLRTENAYLREQQSDLERWGPGLARLDGKDDNDLDGGVRLPPLGSPRDPRARGRGHPRLRARRRSQINARPPSAMLQPQEAVTRLKEAETVIHEYMRENDSIKAENEHLVEWQKMMSREHGSAMRENDELRRRLESLEQVFVQQGRGALPPDAAAPPAAAPVRSHVTSRSSDVAHAARRPVPRRKTYLPRYSTGGPLPGETLPASQRPSAAAQLAAAAGYLLPGDDPDNDGDDPPIPIADGAPAAGGPRIPRRSPRATRGVRGAGRGRGGVRGAGRGGVRGAGRGGVRGGRGKRGSPGRRS